MLDLDFASSDQLIKPHNTSINPLSSQSILIDLQNDDHLGVGRLINMTLSALTRSHISNFNQKTLIAYY